MMAAFESLRHAGVPAALSSSILEKQLNRTLRAYARGGRRAYTRPAELASQLRALWAADPMLAHHVEQSYQLAEQLIEEPARAAAAASAPIFSPGRHERYTRQLVVTRR